MTPPKAALVRIQRAILDKSRAEDEYRAALAAAHAAGWSYTAIGQVAGVSRQAVHKFLRHPQSDDTPAR